MTLATESPIYNWLVRYHYEQNLQACIPYINKGRVNTTKNKPLEEGEENDYTKGYLIVENGDTLIQRLMKDKVILDRDMPRFVEVNSYQQFASFLNEYNKKDGAFVYDSKNKRMARVSKLSNSTPVMHQAREEVPNLIPSDFFNYDHKQPLTNAEIDGNMGTKTDLAATIPVAQTTEESKVRAYMIKRTAYGQLGLGKVVQFDASGLRKEIFFEYDTNNSLVAIERFYQRNNRKVSKVKEENKNLEDILKN